MVNTAEALAEALAPHYFDAAERRCACGALSSEHAEHLAEIALAWLNEKGMLVPRDAEQAIGYRLRIRANTAVSPERTVVEYWWETGEEEKAKARMRQLLQSARHQYPNRGLRVERKRAINFEWEEIGDAGLE